MNVEIARLSCRKDRGRTPSLDVSEFENRDERIDPLALHAIGKHVPSPPYGVLGEAQTTHRASPTRPCHLSAIAFARNAPGGYHLGQHQGEDFHERHETQTHPQIRRPCVRLHAVPNGLDPVRAGIVRQHAGLCHHRLRARVARPDRNPAALQHAAPRRYHAGGARADPQIRMGGDGARRRHGGRSCALLRDRRGSPSRGRDGQVAPAERRISSPCGGGKRAAQPRDAQISAEPAQGILRHRRHRIQARLSQSRCDPGRRRYRRRVHRPERYVDLARYSRRLLKQEHTCG